MQMLKKLWCVMLAIGLLGGTALAQDVKQITFGAKRDVDPAVSPNGKCLAFSSNRTGGFNLFMVTFDQAGESQLTQGKKDDRNPNWSADSKKILFCSKRTGNNDLYETSVDGASGFLQLTDREDIEVFPSFTPSGSGLLFARAPKKAVQFTKNMSVVLLDPRGSSGNTRVLAEGEAPRYSPDGKKIVFVSDRTKNKDIWVMNPDGTQQTQLTTAPKDDTDPCFSPDGKKIVFASERTGQFDLWVMDADGTNQRQISSDPADETQPFWSVGGYLYFTRDLGEGKSNIFRVKAP